MRIKQLSLLIVFLLAACGADPTPVTPQTDLVATAVSAALTAAPQALPPTPYPTYTPNPTLDLSGLFCEYKFCIGHPANFPLFDLEAANDYATSRSDYAQGNLIGFNEQLYIFLLWSQISGQFDSAVALTFVLGQDLPADTIIREDIHGRPVTYVPLLSTPSEILPYGLAAAWECGDRWFGWKAYSAQEDQPLNLLWEAVSHFTCQD